MLQAAAAGRVEGFAEFLRTSPGAQRLWADDQYVLAVVNAAQQGARASGRELSDVDAARFVMAAMQRRLGSANLRSKSASDERSKADATCACTDEQCSVS